MAKLSMEQVLRIILILIACLYGSVSVDAKDPDVDQRTKVKAAIVFHLANMVIWPDSKLGEDDEALRIGIVGSEPGGLADYMRHSLEFRKIQGRRIVIRSFDRNSLGESQPSGPSDSCHVLMVIGEWGGLDPAKILRRFGRHVLTVGDLPRFANDDGMVSISFEKGRSLIRVNLGVVEAEQLSISSEFLRHAEIVKTKEAP